DDDRTAERVREDAASAEASGVRGAPTFFIGERRHTGPYEAGTLARELEEYAAAQSGAHRAD
ncbi:DsbA family protein, partial [Streptomyces griseoflavus]|uniref:DsbA family protein n=1 Tax=Streptomyces griseoflavus TaxID=35619 RepID=UPI0001B500B2